MVDAYEDSDIINSLRKRKRTHKPLRIAFLDIDSTMTGSIQRTNATRKKLERLHYNIVYVTSRTEEMLLSKPVYEMSKQHGFDRPEPHLGRKNELCTAVPPELSEPEGLLNPEIIAGSTGTQIIVRKDNSYFQIDTTYDQRFETTPDTWREEMLGVISQFNEEKHRAYLALYEDPTNYLEGRVDVYPPKYRIVLFFQSTTHKLAFRQYVKHWEMKNGRKLNLAIIDDSHPQKEKYTLRLTPKQASKRKAVDHMITKICGELQIEKNELEVLLAGDSMQDLEMGLIGAKGTKARFLLVGGSRISHALCCKKRHEELFDEHSCEMKAYINASKIKGYYSFSHQLYSTREIIVADEVCAGKKAAESILSILED